MKWTVFYVCTKLGYLQNVMTAVAEKCPDLITHANSYTVCEFPVVQPIYREIKLVHVFTGVALATRLCMAAIREMLKYPSAC